MKSLYLCNFISGVPFDSEKDLGKNLRDVHAVVPEESGHNNVGRIIVTVHNHRVMKMMYNKLTNELQLWMECFSLLSGHH